MLANYVACDEKNIRKFTMQPTVHLKLEFYYPEITPSKNVIILYRKMQACYSSRRIRNASVNLTHRDQGCTFVF